MRFKSVFQCSHSRLTCELWKQDKVVKLPQESEGENLEIEKKFTLVDI